MCEKCTAQKVLFYVKDWLSGVLITGCQLIPIFLYNSYILDQNPIF